MAIQRSRSGEEEQGADGGDYYAMIRKARAKQQGATRLRRGPHSRCTERVCALVESEGKKSKKRSKEADNMVAMTPWYGSPAAACRRTNSSSLCLRERHLNDVQDKA